MKQNYFIVDGEKCYTGTVFLVHDALRQDEATFLYYDTEYKKFVYKVRDCTWSVYPELFQKKFVSVIARVDSDRLTPQARKKSDFDIDELVVGWIWYIFLMLISAIFKEAVGMWIIISIAFFSWRKTVIDKKGTFTDWNNPR